MIFNLRKKELVIEYKDKEIHDLTKELHKKIESDRKEVKKLNAVLANGIILRVAKATGHR